MLDKLRRKKMTSEQDSAHEVVSCINDIIETAIARRASDIHFEPMASSMEVRFRVDGQLVLIETLPMMVKENIIARLKVMGRLLTYRTDIPQEGHIEFGMSDIVTDQRLAVFPTIHGERGVIRLFYKNLIYEGLDELGFNRAISASLEELCKMNQGVVLLTGPAGAGKSTTMCALLKEIHTSCPGKSIVSLEDPVERQLEGVTQTEITTHGELTYPVALRSLLRQDPQVLMIGEVRDKETAGIVIDAGLSGHLLLTSMHGGTPGRTLLRLLEMGIAPYQITSSIKAIVNQRLLRKVCEHCKQTDDTGGVKSGRCDTCLNTGYHDRVLAAELVTIDGDLRDVILNKGDLDTLDHVIAKRGHMTLKQDAQRLVTSGLTTIDELQRVC